MIIAKHKKKAGVTIGITRFILVMTVVKYTAHQTNCFSQILAIGELKNIDFDYTASALA